jgi:hypothetical protein
VSRVFQMDEYRPRLVLAAADRSLHVVPVALVEAVIEGRKPITAMDERAVRAMLFDYLTMLQEQHEP